MDVDAAFLFDCIAYVWTGLNVFPFSADCKSICIQTPWIGTAVFPCSSSRLSLMPLTGRKGLVTIIKKNSVEYEWGPYKFER